MPRKSVWTRASAIILVILYKDLGLSTWKRESEMDQSLNQSMLMIQDNIEWVSREELIPNGNTDV